MPVTAKKVLLLGSGGLSIGQAGEFDYSGTQAIKALREEGVQVIVINPNIATVQTDPGFADAVYLYPVEPEWVEKVIAHERPDAILAGFGGQTGLNCVLRLEELGILDRYAVRNLGTPLETLRLTEDRELFARHMGKIGMPVPPSVAVTTLEDAYRESEHLGFPLIIRAAYALGGLGSGFAYNRDDLRALAEAALSKSPQILLEKSLKGWKEVEYEVMRDAQGNTITICNMENIDPLGIHTGDSIVVAPSQSLSDEEYQTLRNAALKIVGSLGIVGECNVQYALSPESHEFFVIEVNARLSRSSALASKASGYPIAYIAAKVTLGMDLLELKNPVTGITYAFFEPALDYITIKMPRWDLGKFRGASRLLGSAMKSVGEIMAIGRTFPETFQKAVRMVSENGEGLSALRTGLDERALRKLLEAPTDERILAVFDAFRAGMGVDAVHALTKIDKWFLSQMRTITQLEGEIAACRDYSSVDAEQWRTWKLEGFGDEQIAGLGARAQGGPASRAIIEEKSLAVREARLKAGVHPVVKKIDTTAAEYPSPSNYLYLTYGGRFHDEIEGAPRPTVLVLGAGAYRIGTSVEFDWCAVTCSRTLMREGLRSVIVNCNPETVSTDYNSSDRLYFEELTLERILDIAGLETPQGVIAAMGGQLPNRLARPLERAGVRILGHSADTIDRAENRSRFSEILDRADVDQPAWTSASTRAEIDAFISQVGMPVLVRPSYVLSGAAMKVAHDRESLDAYLAAATDVSPDHPVVVSEFLEGAREVELDGVARDGEVITSVISEHLENAGVHSGDASMVVPAQRLYLQTVREITRAGRRIARELGLNGPFNMQFLARSNHVKVIECNARASRSFPFVSKVMGMNLAEIATDVMLGIPARIPSHRAEPDHVGVKAAMFSFSRIEGVDPVLGVEMASTGEVGCIGPTFEEALLLALQSSGLRVPKKGVLVSSGREHEKLKFLASSAVLKRLGLPIYATPGTAAFLVSHGYSVTRLAWPGEGEDDVIRAIRERRVDLVINVPKSWQKRELDQGMKIRKAAISYGCSLLTNMEKTTAFMDALARCPDLLTRHRVKPL